MPALDLATVIRELIILFVVIDPIGTLPVFFFATRDVPEHLHWRFALRAVLVAGAVLFFFLIAGQLLLEGIGLRLGSFQIAGGVVLFLFAMTMVFGEAKPAREIEEAERDHMAGAVFPLAIPSIASPGAMLAVVILTDNHRNTLSDQAMTGVLLFLILLATLAILLLARPIKRLIGNTGANIVSRVMGIILATVAVDSVMSGFEALGVLELQGAGI
ncbi:MAG: MarC family transcriptional regulator [Alphaproteobacteria bacterium HGW-Alphaproteobacteria-4]|nr:MAG: MarC family transcriptional regulator [Alphaproteobacteria bacterium HGW-Alphaproteobacteria-4]